jgi:hypothetical protein
MGSSISVGGYPAASGAIRLENAAWITARNAANGADVNVVRVNTSDALEVGKELRVVGANDDVNYYLAVRPTVAGASDVNWALVVKNSAAGERTVLSYDQSEGITHIPSLFVDSAITVCSPNAASTQLAAMFANSNTGNGSGAQLLIGPYNGSYMAAIEAAGNPYNSTLTYLWLRPRLVAGALGNGVFIDSSDNVGIGTGVSTLSDKLRVVGTIRADGAFGCNTKLAQAAYASGGALAAYATGTYGFDTADHASKLYAMVVAIRAMAVANGLMS